MTEITKTAAGLYERIIIISDIADVLITQEDGAKISATLSGDFRPGHETPELEMSEQGVFRIIQSCKNKSCGNLTLRVKIPTLVYGKSPEIEVMSANGRIRCDHVAVSRASLMAGNMGTVYFRGTVGDSLYIKTDHGDMRTTITPSSDEILFTGFSITGDIDITPIHTKGLQYAIQSSEERVYINSFVPDMEGKNLRILCSTNSGLVSIY